MTPQFDQCIFMKRLRIFERSVLSWIKQTLSVAAADFPEDDLQLLHAKKKVVGDNDQSPFIGKVARKTNLLVEYIFENSDADLVLIQEDDVHKVIPESSGDSVHEALENSFKNGRIVIEILSEISQEIGKKVAAISSRPLPLSYPGDTVVVNDTLNEIISTQDLLTGADGPVSTASSKIGMIPPSDSSSHQFYPECYIKDLIIECGPNDTKSPVLDAMRIAILPPLGLINNSLPLERVSPTSWNYNGFIELSPITEDPMIVVRSKDGNSLGRIALTAAELGNIKTSVHHVKKLVPEAGAPPLMISFEICSMPPVKYRMRKQDWFALMHGDSPVSMVEDPKLLFAMVSALPDDLPHKRRLLTICGDIFLDCFRNTGDEGEINNSILAYGQAIQHAPHDDRISDDQVEMAALQSHLGTSFMSRFNRIGNLEDLDQATSAYQKAVLLTPESHPDMVLHLYNLGITFRSFFHQRGNLEDLDQAMSTFRKVILLTPDGHADKPRSLSDFGATLLFRFEQSRNIADLDEAISIQQKAINLTPDGHAHMPERLNNLGTSLMHRFEHDGLLNNISEAIVFQQKAINLIPEGHPDMPRWLSNLWTLLMRRFKHTKDIDDISEAISIQQTAINLTPDGHPDMPGRLSNLGTSYMCHFEHTGNLTDISKATSLQQNAIYLIPQTHPDMARQLSNLGTIFQRRFERTGDLTDIHNAISNYRLASISSFGSPSIHLNAAKNWAKWSLKYDPVQSLDAYDTAIRLVSRIGAMEYTLQQHYANLVDISDLSSAAAAAAFSFGRYEIALEWFEQGRCLVWNQFNLNVLRTPLEDLQAYDPALANHFSETSRKLETSFRSRRESLSIVSMQKNMPSSDRVAHVKLALEWDELLNEVRNLPGFEGFLRPRKYSDLLSSLSEAGPVVAINVHDARCDALALISGIEDPLHIPLVNFSYKRADDLQSRLKAYLSSHNIPSQESKSDESGMPHYQNSSVIREILAELWVHVVKPVLNGLGFSSPSSHLPRIWWCATGPLAFLPIHAAGLYGQDNTPLGSCLSDFAISSYTPTVSALVERTNNHRKVNREPSKLLLISEPNTPGFPQILSARSEIDTIYKRMVAEQIETLRLEDAATVGQVEQEMSSYSWIHLACHAIQDAHDPLKSGFCLHDGRLEFSRILRNENAKADLAFLSVCLTSTGDEKLPEEAIPLASGMLAAGYQGVIATMWPTMDSHAPYFAEDFYDNLFSGMPDGMQGLNSAAAAQALHYATRRLRERLGDSESSLLAWVPYVHFGV